MSSDSSMYYYFTNQRNLLQAIAKGYFCNPVHWDKKAVEFQEEISFIPDGYLWFSVSALDLPYSYKNDKTLFPVAIGLEDKKLLELGFLETKLDKDQLIFIGDKIIPMDIVDIILFRIHEDLSTVRMRSGEYLDLLNPNVFSFSQNSEFDDTIAIPSNIKKIPKAGMSNEIETRLSKSIGAIGNCLIQLNEDERNSYIILFDIINSYLRDEIDCDFERIRKELEQFGWNITDQDIITSVVMIVSNRHDELKNKIEHIEKFSNVSKISVKEYNIKLSLVFLDAINGVLYKINEEINTLDRITILDEIIGQLKRDLSKNIIEDRSTLEILNTIKGVFDYTADPKDVYEMIDGFNCDLVKIIFRGFEIYIKEPVKKEKIKILLGQENNLPSEICKVLPLFIWGKARGAFSFEPNSKKDMLKRISNKGFYSNCLDMKSLKEFNFALLNGKEPHNDINDEEVSFGNYGIYLEKKDPIEHTTYEEIQHSIHTSTGLTLVESIKDEYIDVLEKILSILEQENLSDDDMEYFLTEHLESKVRIQLGKKKFTTDGIEEINIGVNHGREIEFKSPINKFSALINMRRSYIHNELVIFLKERYNKIDYHEIIPLSEKKKLRKYFSSKDIPTSEHDSQTEKVINKEIPRSDQEKPYEKMTVKQLKLFMKDKNISGRTGNKDDLISRIKASENEIDIFFK